MNRRFYDENIVTGLLAGGFGIMLYDVFQVLYGTWFVKPLSTADFYTQICPMVFAGFLVAVFAVFYALLSQLLRKNQSKKKV